MENPDKALAAVIEAIRRLNDEWAKIRVKPSRQRLAAAAPESGVAALAADFGLKSDDPYLQFLRLHDGWNEYSPGESLLSSADLLGTGKQAQRLRDAKQAQAEVGDAGAQAGFVVAVGNANDYCVYLDAKGDSTKTRAAVEWDAGGVIMRHTNFLAFLEARRDALREAMESDRKRRR